jgi:hypothetical protein
MTTKQKLTAVAQHATTRLVAAADAALVAQGKAARARQRKRALKAALKAVGKTVAMAGTAAATVMAARAIAGAMRRRTARSA